VYPLLRVDLRPQCQFFDWVVFGLPLPKLDNPIRQIFRHERNIVAAQFLSGFVRRDVGAQLTVIVPFLNKALIPLSGRKRTWIFDPVNLPITP